MKRKMKGFTLAELIIVLALFSLIMYSVIQLIDPVSKYFVRSSNFESNTACVDNIKRSIEGNLKYADRVRAYRNFAPYDTDYTDEPDISSDLSEHLESFYSYFFDGRKAIDSAGYIYVLVLDNTAVSTATLDGLEKLSDFYGSNLNSGKMILYRFWFNNYDTNYDSFDEVLASVNGTYSDSGAEWVPANVSPAPDILDWYVNPKLYGNYEYRFDLGSLSSTSTTLDDEGNVVFNAADFVISISMTEISRDKTRNCLQRTAVAEHAESTFSMKNVLDSSVSYTKSAVDYVLKANDEGTPGFSYTSTAKNRYATMQTNPNADEFDGYYFIFTLPETTYTNNTYVGQQG